MKRQYIYLSIAAGLVLLTFVILLLLQSVTNKAANQTPISTGGSQNPNNTQQTGETQGNTGNTAVGPDQVAKDFYSTYFASPSNFLATYRSNTSISAELKSYIESIGSGKDDPVFCSQNHSTNVTFDPPDYSSDNATAYITVRDASQNGKQIYSIELDKLNGKWLAANVQCL